MLGYIIKSLEHGCIGFILTHLLGQIMRVHLQEPRGRALM